MGKLRNIFLITILFPASFLFSSPADSSYYPLALGNSWAFYSDFYPHTEQITDTLRTNGNLYYGLSPSDSIPPQYWLRESGSQVFCLNKADSSEFVLFDFSMEPGDSIELPPGYECSFGHKIFLSGKNDTVITPAGTFYNCYHFEHRPLCADAGIFDTWFCRGTGKVKYRADNISGIKQYLLEDYTVITKLDVSKNRDPGHSFYLFPNYPNPFNHSTIITFQIPVKEEVILSIYNALGQEIKKIFEGFRPAGANRFTWDGRDSNNYDISSGIYFIHVKAGPFFKTRKCLLIK